MPTLTTRYNFGENLSEENPELFKKLSDNYTSISLVVNTKMSKRVISGSDPPASSAINKNFDIGDVWVRTDTDDAWIMTSRTTSSDSVWTLIT